MRKFITGLAFLAFASVTQAEVQFIPELLAGQSINLIRSTSSYGQTIKIYKNKLNANSYGLRLGIKFSDNFTVELAKHFHGEITDKHMVSYPRCVPGGGGPGREVCLPPEGDYTFQTRTPIDTESIRLGVKVNTEVYQNLFLTAGIGIAHWQYNRYKPIELVNGIGRHLEEKSSNDPYYSLGAQYKLSKNMIIGLEYSLLTITQKMVEHELGYVKGTHHINDISLTAAWLF